MEKEKRTYSLVRKRNQDLIQFIKDNKILKNKFTDKSVPSNLLKKIIKILIAIAQIVAIPAFLIALYTFIYPLIKKVEIQVIPETQVQLTQAEVNLIKGSRDIIAFNNLVTIFAIGPSGRSETIKFNFAEVDMPDGQKVLFSCRSYIDEIGRGQTNKSRNVPVAVKGGDNLAITAAYQSDSFSKWVTGKYSVVINATNSRGKNIHVPRFTFILDQHDLDIISSPNSIYEKQVQIE